MPRVSVIIPTFNYGHILSEALESVLCQSLSDWECIVVDDGSIDDTPEVMNTFLAKDSRMRYFRQTNKGPSCARNYGLTTAKGDYIQLLDADDLIEPDKLRVQADFLDAHKDYAGVYGPARYFQTSFRNRRRSFARSRSHEVRAGIQSVSKKDLLLSLVNGNQFAISAPLFRLQIAKDIGLFDETLSSHEDWDFWLRIAFRGGDFAWLDGSNVGTEIRVHDRSLTMNSVSMAETRLTVRQRIRAFTKDEEVQSRNSVLVGYDQCALGAVYFKARRFADGLRITREGLTAVESKLRACRLLLANLAPGWLLEAYRRTRHSLSGS